MLPLLNDLNVAVFGKVANPEIFAFKYALQVHVGGDYFAIVLRFYEGVEVFGFFRPVPQVT
jgi:hypothetical protein